MSSKPLRTEPLTHECQLMLIQAGISPHESPVGGRESCLLTSGAIWALQSVKFQFLHQSFACQARKNASYESSVDACQAGVPAGESRREERGIIPTRHTSSLQPCLVNTASSQWAPSPEGPSSPGLYEIPGLRPSPGVPLDFNSGHPILPCLHPDMRGPQSKAEQSLGKLSRPSWPTGRQGLAGGLTWDPSPAGRHKPNLPAGHIL